MLYLRCIYIKTLSNDGQTDNVRLNNLETQAVNETIESSNHKVAFKSTLVNETIESLNVNGCHKLAKSNRKSVLKQFDWVCEFAPAFLVDGSQVQVLREPQEFYDCLLVSA